MNLRSRTFRAFVFGVFTTLGGVGCCLHADSSFNATLSERDDLMLEEIQRASFRFFQEQSNPRTGLVADRARLNGGDMGAKASVAASGFGFSGWVIATERGWVTRDEAKTRVEQSLRFLLEKAPRHHGFFYHFMEMDSGDRAWQCELSPIDTTLMLAGAVVAREYFQDEAVTALVNRLYGEIDWPWMLAEGQTLALGWHDETGFARYRWHGFSELMVMELLGLGAPERPLPADHWQRWQRQPRISYGGMSFLEGAPLFMHQFSQAYFDFRDSRDAFADYFENSRLATLAQRRMSIELATEFPSWGPTLWGVTASDSERGYHAWGGPPRSRGGAALDGTIVPCAAGGSLPFAPSETLAVLRRLRAEFGDRIWGRYGFADAFNPETGWVATDALGIDVGITLVQAENLRSGLIWKLFNQAPEVRRARSLAGFVPAGREVPAEQRDAWRELAKTLWPRLQVEGLTELEPGFQLASLLAAQGLGLIDPNAVTSAARDILEEAAPVSSPAEWGRWVASLLALRQAQPELARRVGESLQTAWTQAPNIPASFPLGSEARLARLVLIGAGKLDTGAWTQATRDIEQVGLVRVLAPADPRSQGWSGLWLDEAGVITGGSAEQLAYHETRRMAGEGGHPELAVAALRLGKLPAAAAGVLQALQATAPSAWIGDANDLAALFVTLGNGVGEESVRNWFQRDPIARQARDLLPEFAAEPFGPLTSLRQRYELSTDAVPSFPRRQAMAVADTSSTERTDWQTMAGSEFLDGPAEMRPGDPDLQVRWSARWSTEALLLTIEVDDTPDEVLVPSGRGRFVEVFLDPQDDGFDWCYSDDLKFDFGPDGRSSEVMQNRSSSVRAQDTDHGYILHVALPWTELGRKPVRGLSLGLSVAAFAGGPRDHDPFRKLNWSYQVSEDGPVRLGRIVLE